MAIDHMQAFLVVQGLKASVQRLGRICKAEGINTSDVSEARQLADSTEQFAQQLKGALAEDVDSKRK